MIGILDDTDFGKIRRSIFVIGIINFSVWWAEVSISFENLFGVLQAENKFILDTEIVIFVLFASTLYFSARWWMNWKELILNQDDFFTKRSQQVLEAFSAFQKSVGIFGNKEGREEELRTLLALIGPVKEASEKILGAISDSEAKGLNLIRGYPAGLGVDLISEKRESDRRKSDLQAQVYEFSPVFEQWLANRSRTSDIMEEFKSYVFSGELKDTIDDLKKAVNADKSKRRDIFVSQLPPLIGFALSMVAFFAGPGKSIAHYIGLL